MSAYVSGYEKRLFKDEHVMGLLEQNLPTPDYKARHRYQIVYAVRGDQIVEMIHDMGPSELFTAQEMHILSLMEHTAAEIVEMAEQVRNKSVHLGSFLAEKQAESTLITDFLQEAEQKQLSMTNVSSFGSAISTQRNGWSAKGAAERVKGQHR